MTDEQMRIKIAEACGWIHHHMRPSETERLQKKWYYLSDLPDYLNDLNAMHEAEKVLKGGMRSKYDAELTLICLRDYNFIWESTAAQRAEAFLKTKGIIP
jgi:hypothetical protein